MADTEPQAVDVLIVGAGINGAGLFRDLCEQGLTCMIIDKGDFGSGTSAAPSRLIHGGLKYLETGEFRLVAESTYERNLLLRNAPHLVEPLPTLIPIFSWTRGIGAALRTFFGATTAPRSRGALLVKAGLWFYDFYGARARRMPRHKMLSRASALSGMPALTPGIVAAGTYFDATVTAPERLVLELVLDGLAASPGSTAMNWTALRGQVEGTVVLCGPDGTQVDVKPRLVANAAGPWIDRVNAGLGLETALIGGTKGAHILLDHPDLVRQLAGRMIYFEANDGRILLVYPYHGKALVGSTDIPSDDPDGVCCEPEETAYFMQALGELLPGLSFHRDQIVFAYAGIRPLPVSDAANPGLISRDHSAPLHPAEPGRPFPVISLVGGKWTTFRAFAAEVADTTLVKLGAERRATTDACPIGGGQGMPVDRDDRDMWVNRVSNETGAAPARVEKLLRRYGTTARAIAAAEAAALVWIRASDDVSEAEIGWIARNEFVCHLEDIVLRRTQLAITGQLTADNLAQICAVVGNALKWNPGRMDAEMDRTRDVLRRRHGVCL